MGQAGKKSRHGWIYLVLAWGIVLAWGGFLAYPFLFENDDAGRDKWVVRGYCSYGSESRPQLDKCLREVKASTVDARNTAAAKFSRSDNPRCGYTAGPYCAGFLEELDAATPRQDDRFPGG